MLRSREGAPSKKFRLAAATAISCDNGHTSTNTAMLCFAMRVWSRSKKETERVLDNRQSCDRHHISRQKRQLFFDGFDIFASAGLLGFVNPAAALGDEALGK